MGNCMSWPSGASTSAAAAAAAGAAHRSSSSQVRPCSPPPPSSGKRHGPASAAADDYDDDDSGEQHPAKIRRTSPFDQEVIGNSLPSPTPASSLLSTAIPPSSARVPLSLGSASSPVPPLSLPLLSLLPCSPAPGTPSAFLTPSSPTSALHPLPSHTSPSSCTASTLASPAEASGDAGAASLAVWGPLVQGSSEEGEFPLSSNPGVLLRILSDYQVAPRDLANLEATCKFFCSPAGFPPDPSLGLAEVAALDSCSLRPAFKAMSKATQENLKTACGGSWKLVLRFLLAREACTRNGRTQVAAGCAHSVAVGSRGEVWSFGHGSVGQLGHGPTFDVEWRPKLIRGLPGVRVVQAAAGRSRTMLVSETGQVFHFGRDCFGDQEYSLASPRPIHSPRLVHALQAVHVVQVAMGSFFTAVLSAEGKVYTFSWGDGDRLGHATDQSDTEARVLEGGGLEQQPVVQIAVGHCYLLALTLSKEHGRGLWSVGCGLGGKLGHGTRSDERQPKEIAHFRTISFEPVAVAAGAWHAVALSSDGRVATWGWGRHGCLGHGSDQCEAVPRVVDSLAGSVACHVAAGDYTTFVVGREGQVWSFGSTESSCLGHGEEAAAPVAPAAPAPGQDEADHDDAADAQLQEAPRQQRPRDVFAPRRVAALEACVGRGDRVVHISTSNAGHWDAHMLALTEHGTVFACGAGSKGQLGCVLPEGGFERAVPSAVEGLLL